jgi:hypothetical protein
MHRWAWLVGGTLVFVAGMWVGGERRADAVKAAEQAASPTDWAAKIRRLQELRRDVLREMVKYREAQFDAGVATPDVLLVARQRLVEAELELADTPEARIALRRDLVAQLAQQETLLKAALENGVARHGDLYHTTAERLAAEIELVREQARFGVEDSAEAAPARD